jgi:ABC-type Fe3+/spermidine/putrescine transport system ATPase subunit
VLLELDAVSKSYGPTEVLQPTSLAVEDGEFLTILGPSGSGKTTILRLVGGFARPTTGRIRFDGADVTDVPTHRRPFNTVFQDYALFPHMNVARNVGYGLMLRRRPKAEIARRVGETLEIVGLSGMLERYPNELSGGQRQRVALARALVCDPRLILLDEPLAALDAGLRRQMQLFLKSLQRQVRTTFLFVTHDQEEATTMSDRIVVMNVGRIEQVGSPKDIYYAPGSRFVAGFFGDNNILEGVIRDGRLHCVLGAFPAPPALAEGSSAMAAIRPEKVRIGGAGATTDIVFPAAVVDVVFAGAITQVLLRPDGSPGTILTAKLTSGAATGSLAQGASVDVRVAPEDAVILPAAEP